MSHWVPMVDGELGLKNPFMPKLPHKMMANFKNEHVKAVILGHNSEEGLIKVAPFLKDPTKFVNFTTQMPEMLFGPDETKRNLQTRIIKLLKR